MFNSVTGFVQHFHTNCTLLIPCVFLQLIHQETNTLITTRFILTNLLTYLLTYLLYLPTYLLIPWSRTLLEKLTGFQLVKKFPHFMESEGSLPHSQEPATCPYPEPARSSPYPTYYFLKNHLNIILPSTPQVSPPKSCIRLFSPP